MLQRLEPVFTELGALAESLTLVGGCLTPLLITDPAAPPPRATIDIDLVVEATSLCAFNQFGDEMRRLGFRPGYETGDPICRFRKGTTIIDLLPTDSAVLGFGNRWYALTAAMAMTMVLPSSRHLHHATAPCFLATKIDAFRGRGRGDYLASHDFEDIVALVDGRPELAVELTTAPRYLQDWVRTEIADMIDERGFLDSLAGMVPGRGDVAGRVELLVERFSRLSHAGTT